MQKLSEFRKKYPQYDDVADADLAFGLYQKFYSDLPAMQFAKGLGLDKGQSLEFLGVASKAGKGLAFESPEPSVGGGVAGTARGVLQGMTLGAGDEIVAGGAALGRKLLQGDDRSLGDIYGQELERERKRIGQFREESPVLAYGSEFAGGAAIPLGAAQTVKGAAALGGATGTAAGFLGSEGGLENRLTGATTGGVLGALLGGGLQAGGKAAMSAFEDYMTQRAAKAAAAGADSIDALRREATDAYEVARNSGVQIDRAAFDNMLDGIIAKVSGRAGGQVRPKLIPKSADVIDAMKELAGRTVGIDDLEYFRQLAQDPAGMVTDKAEQRAASMIIKGIDDFVGNISPDQISVNPEMAQSAAQSLTKARELWGRMRRTETIDNIVTAAKEGGYAGGFESGLKNQIGSILRNPKKRRGFSKDEISLLSQIQKGTPVGRILSGISYLGFSPSGGRSGLLTSGGTWGGVLATGNVIPALMGATASTALRYVREMSLEDQARLYTQIIASGKAGDVIKQYPSVMRYLENIAARATTGGATQMPYDILNR